MDKKPTVCQGKTVLWYRYGHTNRAGATALVTRSSKDGILDLAVFTPGARNVEPVMNVRHLDDPIFNERPKLAESDGNGRPGKWDFIPEDKPVCVSTSSVVPDPAASWDEMSDEERVLLLYAEKGDLLAVAEAMTENTGQQWTVKRVGNIVKKAAM